MTEYDKKTITSVVTLLIILCFLPFLCLVWYTNPLDEKLICHSDFNCNIYTKRAFGAQTVKTFRINEYTTLTSNMRYKSHGRYSVLNIEGYNYDIQIDDNKLFIFPICLRNSRDNKLDAFCSTVTNNVINDFREYKQGLSEQFVVSSCAKESNRFWFYVIFQLSFLIIITAIFFYIDLDFFKEYRKKQKRERNYKKKCERKARKKSKQKNSKQKRVMLKSRWVK